MTILEIIGIMNETPIAFIRAEISYSCFCDKSISMKIFTAIRAFDFKIYHYWEPE
jgi:hypothetical protein